MPLQDIAKQLNVDVVLEGAVLQSGSRVRIRVQAIQADGGKHLWAKEYDLDGRDILNVQSEIAKDIAAEIPIRLQPAEERRLGQDRPVNPEAYEAYLKGQFLWKKRTVKDLNKSIEYFQQAVRLDPAWGRGYAGLAEAHLMLGYGAMVSLAPDETAVTARAFALKAMELDDTLAAPHAVLGLIKHRHDWDSKGAASEFQRAIELDPSYVTAHYWYANYLQSIGRPDEEMAQLEIARHLDPIYSLVLSGIANNLDAAGHRQEALAVFTQAISVDENNWVLHSDLGGSYARHGDYDQAIREFSRVVELSDGNLRAKASLARMYALTGRENEARGILEEIKGKTNSAFSVAEIYVALGEKDPALKYLQQAMDERCGWVVFMWSLPSLEPLRSDPRFKELVARVGFPAA